MDRDLDKQDQGHSNMNYYGANPHQSHLPSQLNQYPQQSYSQDKNNSFGHGFDDDMDFNPPQSAHFNAMGEQRKPSSEYQNYGPSNYNGHPPYSFGHGPQIPPSMNQYKPEEQPHRPPREDQSHGQGYHTSSQPSQPQRPDQSQIKQSHPNPHPNTQSPNQSSRPTSQNQDSSQNDRVDTSSLLNKSPQQSLQNKYPNAMGSQSQSSALPRTAFLGQPGMSNPGMQRQGPQNTNPNQMQNIWKNFFETIKRGDIDAVMSEREKYNIDIKSITDESQYKQNPLFAASQIKDEQTAIKLIEIFIQAGLNPTLTDGLQQTPLYYAAKDGKNHLLEVLVKNGANVNQIDTYGQTPIFYAAREGKVDTLKKLQEMGADLDVVDNNGQTPLYYSIKQGKLEACEFLVKSGANVNNEDKKGVKPVAHARKLQKQSIVEMLIQHGAQPLSESNKNKQPQKKQPAPPKQRVNEKKIPKRFQLTKLKDGGYVPLSEEEYNQFKQNYPDLARYFEEENAIDGLQIPDVNENAPIYDNWDKAAKRLVQTLMKMQQAYIFLEPVDPVKLNIPDYPNIIKNPMDLGTIKNNLNANKYAKMDEFIKDVHLVFDNCFLYNGENSYVSGLCKQVKEEFQKLYDSLSMEFYM